MRILNDAYLRTSPGKSSSHPSDYSIALSSREKKSVAP